MSQTLVTPIFPLPNLVFFPHTFLPLHIFEPRYRTMTSDALESHRMLAMVQLRPNWEKDYEGMPGVYGVATLSRIVHHERLEDGRYNILLQGMQRIRIVRELDADGRAYRQVLADVMESVSATDLVAQREAKDGLLAMSHRLVELRPQFKPWFDKVMATFEDPDVHADLIAAFLSNTFNIDPYDLQSILEEIDVGRRLQLIAVQFRRVLSELVENSA